MASAWSDVEQKGIRRSTGKLIVPATTSFVLAVDATDGDPVYRRHVIHLISDLIQSLPVECWSALYFLGNRKPYQLLDFKNQAKEWMDENAGRVRLVTTVFDAVGESNGAPPSFLIIRRGKIHDLHDWEETEQLQRTIIVTIDHENRKAYQEVADVKDLLNPTAEELREACFNPLVTITIDGQGFMPIQWTNEAYQFCLTERGAQLVAHAKNGVGDFDCVVSYLIAENNEPQAKVERAGGKLEILPLTHTVSSDFPLSDRQLLRPEEQYLFHQAIRKQDIHCLVCNKPHRWYDLWCTEAEADFILGVPVYPSLRDMRGWVLFEDTEAGVVVSQYPSNVLITSSHQVYVRDRNGLLALAYNPAKVCWDVVSEQLPQYLPVGEKQYAVYL